jgi:NAD(P)-dependent dehydrogenase (short-subunit alcohol dehydrogenase family)
MAYHAYWTVVLVVGAPCAAIVLLGRAGYQIVAASLSRLWSTLTRRPPSHAYYHPRYASGGTSSSACRRAVIITGCDSGLGRGLALAAARQGFVVFAGCLRVEVSEPSLNQEFQQSSSATGELHAFPLDVTSDADCQNAVNLVEQWLQASHTKEGERQATAGRRVLHALVNNAGIGVIGEVDWIPMESFQRVMNGTWCIHVSDPSQFMPLNVSFGVMVLRRAAESMEKVNYFGTVRMCKAFLPVFQRQSISMHLLRTNAPQHNFGTRILNIVSVAGRLAGMGMSAYSASKHATLAFTTALRNELKPWKIQMVAINPSFHGTQLVAAMESGLRETWGQLTATKQAEYGRGATFL